MKTIKYLFFGLLVFGSLSLLADVSPWDAWRLGYTNFEAGEKLRDQGDYTKALEAFTKALEHYHQVQRTRPDWNQKVIQRRIADCEKECARMRRLLGKASTPGRQAVPGGVVLGNSEAAQIDRLKRELDAMKLRLAEATAELESLRKQDAIKRNFEAEITHLMRDQRVAREKYALLEKRYRQLQNEKSKPDRQVADLEARLLEQKMSIEQFRKQIAAMKNQLAEADRERRTLTAARTSLQTQLNQKTADIERLEHEIAALQQARNDSIANQKLAQQNLESSAQELRRAREQIKELTAALEELREKLRTTGVQDTAVAEENRKLHDENLQLQGAVDRLMHENGDLKRKVGSLEQEIARLSGSLQQAETARLAAVQERDSMRQNTTVATANSERASAELASLRDKLALLEADLKNALERNQKLEQRLAQRNDQDFKNLTEAADERQRLREQLEKLTAENLALKNGADDSAAQITQLKRQIEELQISVKKAVAERDILRERSGENQNAQARLTVLEKEYTQLQTNFQALQKENRELKISVDAAKPQEAELAQIRLRLLELDSLKNRLSQEQRLTAEQQAMVRKLEKELAASRTLQLKFEEAQREIAALSALREEIARLKKLNADLAAAKNLESELAQAKLKLAETETLRGEVLQLRKLNEELSASHNAQREELTRLRAEAADFNRAGSALAAANKRIEELTADLKLLRAEAESSRQLKEQLAVLREQLDKLKKINLELIKYQQMEPELTKLRTYPAAMQQLQEQLAQLRQLLRAAEEKLQKNKTELGELRLRSIEDGRFRDEVAFLKQKLAVLSRQEQELAASQAELQSLRTEVERLRQNQPLQPRQLQEELTKCNIDRQLLLKQIRTLQETEKRLSALLAKESENSAAALEIIKEFKNSAASPTAAGAAQGDVAKLNAELAALRKANEDLLRQANADRTAVNEARIRLAELESFRYELEQLRSRPQAAPAQGQTATPDLAALRTRERELESLRDEVEKLRRRNAELLKIQPRIEAELERARIRLAAVDALNAELERLRKLNQELAQAKLLEGELAQAKLRLTELENVNAELVRLTQLNNRIFAEKQQLEQELASRPRLFIGSGPSPQGETMVLPPAAPGKPGDLVASGILAEADDSIALAIWNYEQALKADPNCMDAAKRLGLLLLRREEFPRAAVLLSEARAREPQNTELSLAAARAFLGGKRFGNALSILEPMLERHAEDYRIQLALGQALDGSGAGSKAEGHFRTAVQLAPRETVTHMELARHLANYTPNLEEAARCYEKARLLGAAPDIELEPKLGSSLDERREMAAFLSSAAAEAAAGNDWKGAVWYYRQLVDLKRDADKFVPRLAFARYKNGEGAAALESLTFNRTTPEGLLVAAVIHFADGDVSELAKTRRQLLALNGGKPVKLSGDWSELAAELGRLTGQSGKDAEVGLLKDCFTTR